MSKKADSRMYVAVYADLSQGTNPMWVVCPMRWVMEDKAGIGVFLNACMTASEMKESNKDVQHFFYPGCVDLSNLEDVFFTANTLYALMDEGYLNSNASEAFQGGK